MKFIDDKSKKVTWWNANYLFIGTVFVIFVLVMLFAIFGSYIPRSVIFDKIPNTLTDYLGNWFYLFLNNFAHGNWTHLFGNSIIVLVPVGMYLERKYGTFSFLLLVLAGSLLSPCLDFVMSNGYNWAGFSVVLHFLYGLAFVDFFFSLTKERRSLTNTILGVILILLYYFVITAFSMTGGANYTLHYAPTLHSLINPVGHLAGLLTGIIVGLAISLTGLYNRLVRKPKEVQAFTANKWVKCGLLVSMCSMLILSAVFAPIAANRREFKVKLIDSSGKTISRSFKFEDDNYCSYQSVFSNLIQEVDGDDFNYKRTYEFYQDPEMTKPLDVFSLLPNYVFDTGFIPLASRNDMTIYSKYIGQFIPVATCSNLGYFDTDLLPRNMFSSRSSMVYDTLAYVEDVQDAELDIRFVLPQYRPYTIIEYYDNSGYHSLRCNSTTTTVKFPSDTIWSIYLQIIY